MVFKPSDAIPKLPFDPPDSVSIFDFIFDEKYGRHPLGKSKAPFVDGIDGREYSASEVRDRVEYLARALAHELDWDPNTGTEWDKVIGLFTLNTVSPNQLAIAVFCAAMSFSRLLCSEWWIGRV